MCIDFISFTNSRRPEYRIKTAIVKTDRGRVVQKTAMTDESHQHLRRIAHLAQQQVQNDCITSVPVIFEQDHVIMPYIDGDNLESSLLQALQVKDMSRFWQLLDNYLNAWQICSEPALGPFIMSEEFRTWFGRLPDEMEAALISEKALPLSNIDQTCDNVFILTENRYIVIDPEWLFDFPVPFRFLQYRALNKLYVRNIAGRFDQVVSWPALAERIGLSSLTERAFRKMEDHFIEHVFEPNLMPAKAVHRLPALDIQRDFAQIFWLPDVSEDLSERINLKDVIQTVAQAVPNGCVSGMRFDPMNSSGMVLILSCSGRDQNGDEVPLILRPQNAWPGDDILSYFSEQDPQYLCQWPEGSITRIMLSFVVWPMSNQELQAIRQYHQQVSVPLREQLAAGQQRILDLDEQIRMLQADNKQAQDEWDAERDRYQVSLSDLQYEQANLIQDNASLHKQVEQLSAELKEKGDVQNEYEKLETYLYSTQEHVGKLEHLIHEKDAAIIHLQQQLSDATIKGKIKKVLRRIGISRNRRLFRVLAHPVATGSKVFSVLRSDGLGGLVRRIRGQGPVLPAHEPEQQSMDEITAINLRRPASFSILMPVYNVAPCWLERAVETVVQQSYLHWQLCLVDDASTNPETRAALDALVKDERIIIRHQAKNGGIASASNASAAIASGDYLILMDHDDEMAPDALLKMALAIETSGADILYSDEDKVTVDGVHQLPFFKPDWSPDLLRAQMYIGHLLCVRKELFDQVGGFDSAFNGSQDYDLVLRLTEKSNKIHHVPALLYSWREIPGSTALDPGSKPYAHTAGLRALDAHLKRVFGPLARADETEMTFVYDARYPFDEQAHLISVIIPFRDQVDLTRHCVESILQKTQSVRFEIILVNNQSARPETAAWIASLATVEHIRVIEADYPFNWSRVNNDGARAARGDVLVFLNNDTEVIAPDWLMRLGENALRPDIGTVGGLLLYEDGKIQHAGVVVGLGGWADHIYKGMDPVHFGSPFVSPMVARNVSASTGACLAISRDHFERLNGFDERFIICGSDVALSIAASREGWFNIYLPKAKLFHLESKSRDNTIPEVDFACSYELYRPYRENGDPFYNTNLDYDRTTPTDRRIVK